MFVIMEDCEQIWLLLWLRTVV